MQRSIEKPKFITNAATHSSNDSIAIFFLNRDIGDLLTGIEHSALQRAHLFKRKLHKEPIIITNRFRPQLSYYVNKHVLSKKYTEAINVASLYDIVLDYSEDIINESTKPPSLDPAEPDFPGCQTEIVPGFKDVKYRDCQGNLFAYKVFSKVTGKLTHINYFHKSYKIAADYFRISGHLASHRIYEPKSREIIAEIYYSTEHIRPIFFRIFKNTINYPLEIYSLDPGFYLIDKSLSRYKPTDLLESDIAQRFDADKIATGLYRLLPLIYSSFYIGNECNFIEWALKKLLTTIDAHKVLFICDRNKDYFEAVCRVRDSESNSSNDNKIHDIRVASVIHSTHYVSPERNSHIKSTYKDLLLSARHADRLIVLSGSQKRDIQQSFPTETIEYIPHTYTRQPYIKSQGSSFFPSNEYAIVYLARLSPEKDHINAINIFQQVHAKAPNARLYIYGEGPERSRIESHLNNQNMSHLVYLKGYCSDVAKVYSSASVAILTSRMEGFSLTLLEAMSYGCPSVAFDINYGPRDLILNEESGFLVPYGDINLFAHQILLLLTDSSMRKKFSLRAIRHFEENFSENKVADRWRKTLENIF